MELNQEMFFIPTKVNKMSLELKTVISSYSGINFIVKKNRNRCISEDMKKSICLRHLSKD